jgi:hypothetical protein
MKPLERLRVVPNPYCELDVDGDPAGAVPRVDLRNSHREQRTVRGEKVSQSVSSLTVLIGATIDPERSKRRPKYVFSADELQIANCREHRAYVKHGALFAADVLTAKACEVPFVAPKAALTKARDAAAAAYLADNGELPSWSSPAPAGEQPARAGGGT